MVKSCPLMVLQRYKILLLLLMGHKILLNVQFLLMKNKSSYKLQWGEKT